MDCHTSIITDMDAAFAELNVLSRRVGWYAMYTACVRYVEKHGLVIPSPPESGLYFQAYLVLKASAEEREKQEKKDFEKRIGRGK
jgi:hypothetical protein